jgi:hypothetical protein
MSLEDLEIRKWTAPIRAELDRQKEKCAAMKKERDALVAALEAFDRHRIGFGASLDHQALGDAQAVACAALAAAGRTR